MAGMEKEELPGKILVLLNQVKNYLYILIDRGGTLNEEEYLEARRTLKQIDKLIPSLLKLEGI